MVSAGSRLEHWVDTLKHRLRERLMPNRPLHIVSYRGYGSVECCTFRGRVLVYKGPVEREPVTVWQSLGAAYRRFETDEVPGVKVQADTPAGPIYTTSDQEGYFHFQFRAGSASAGGILTVPLSLPERPSQHSTNRAEVFVPSPSASFGVISDIDDTVLVTQATSLLRMIRLTLLESSRDRLAFPGAAAFYRALHQGVNPFFYVSSSPWNLYQFLQEFMRHNGFVDGPMLLREFGLERGRLVAGSHVEHKEAEIRGVMDRFPALPFLLIGDSGQEDPEIYTRVVEAYPGRILAIYIRDVSGDGRDRRVETLRQRVANRGVDMVLASNSYTTAQHAAGHGYIAPDALPTIAAAVGSGKQDDVAE